MTNQEKKNLLYTERLALESALNSSDYKVIKCAEATAMGTDLPYDMEALHAERQAKRDRINAIEEEIANIPDDEEVMPDDGEEVEEEGAES